MMDYVRGVAFGYSKGESLASYWKKHNTDYATVDAVLGKSHEGLLSVYGKQLAE